MTTSGGITNQPVFSIQTHDGRLPGCERDPEHQVQSELLSLRLGPLRNSVNRLRARMQS